MPKICRVAPHAGAWIETPRKIRTPKKVFVAPHAGAWIETHQAHKRVYEHDVAPHAGAWIETTTSTVMTQDVTCRSPCGSVD